jgi:hypothetical protein
MASPPMPNTNRWLAAWLKENPRTSPAGLPESGYVSWCAFCAICPLSKKLFDKLVHRGRAPQCVQDGKRRVYSVHELRRWLADPANYRVPRELMERNDMRATYAQATVGAQANRPAIVVKKRRVVAPGEHPATAG